MTYVRDVCTEHTIDCVLTYICLHLGKFFFGIFGLFEVYIDHQFIALPTYLDCLQKKAVESWLSEFQLKFSP